MALIKPILLSQVAFDATKSQELEFVVTSGSQVVKNRLKVIDNDTGLVVYNELQETFKSIHTISPNKLINGHYYQATLQTSDKDNNLSPWSNNIQFYCYTTPVLSIINIPLDSVIDNANFNFEAKYSQAQGEKLNLYKFILYDSLNIQIADSGTRYANSETVLNYIFTGLENKKNYKIEVQGLTANGTSVTTSKISFTVSYTLPSIFAALDLENNCDKGNILITSRIVDIEGKSNPSPPIYINNEKVDLTKDGSWVLWDTGYNIKDDFSLGIWGYKFGMRKDLCFLWGDNFNNKISISLNYNDDNTKIFAQMYCYQDNQNYYCYSNYTIPPSDEGQIFIGVKRINNIYGIKIEDKEVV